MGVISVKHLAQTSCLHEFCWHFVLRLPRGWFHSDLIMERTASYVKKQAVIQTPNGASDQDGTSRLLKSHNIAAGRG